MRVVFGRETRPHQAGLFDPGNAWLWTADAWAEANGVTITRRYADQRFEVEGQVYRVDWRDDGWHVAEI